MGSVVTVCPSTCALKTCEQVKASYSTTLSFPSSFSFPP